MFNSGKDEHLIFNTSCTLFNSTCIHRIPGLNKRTGKKLFYSTDFLNLVFFFYLLFTWYLQILLFHQISKSSRGRLHRFNFIRAPNWHGRTGNSLDNICYQSKRTVVRCEPLCKFVDVMHVYQPRVKPLRIAATLSASNNLFLFFIAHERRVEEKKEALCTHCVHRSPWRFRCARQRLCKEKFPRRILHTIAAKT